jgi:hypothetical protein
MSDEEWIAGMGMKVDAARKHDRVNTLISVRDLTRLLALAEECLKRRKEAER